MRKLRWTHWLTKCLFCFICCNYLLSGTSCFQSWPPHSHFSSVARVILLKCMTSNAILSTLGTILYCCSQVLTQFSKKSYINFINIRLDFIKVYSSCFYLLCYMVAVKLDEILKCSTFVRASHVKEQNKYIEYGY